MPAFFVSIPHCGEGIPPEATWLTQVPDVTLFRDVDRFVDVLYGPALERLKIPFVKADIHRYVVDLNRLPADVDKESVEGSMNPSGSFTTGYHWVQTTQGEILLPKPLTQAQHEALTTQYYEPFHQKIREQFFQFKVSPTHPVFHLDAHSMPSQATAAHRDAGQTRPDIVVSDQDGTSCARKFSDLVQRAYAAVGFQVAYNWPYKGGRITQTYGQPQKGQHTLQVEMNRRLYMNENTHQIETQKAGQVQIQVQKALEIILLELASF
jgi:N-formylglutamate amidohydrolase